MTAEEMKRSIETFFWEGPPYYSRPIHRNHREMMEKFDEVRDFCDSLIEQDAHAESTKIKRGA